LALNLNSPFAKMAHQKFPEWLSSDDGTIRTSGTGTRSKRGVELRKKLPLILVGLTLMTSQPAASGDANQSPRGGPHDFDWEIGSWKTDLLRLKQPLSGSKEWIHYTGLTTVRGIWHGKSNLVELDVNGPPGRFEAISLRLYDPETRQWGLFYANSRGGGVSMPPLVGGFKGKRGDFYDEEEYKDRKVLVHFVITVLNRNCAQFKQAFSADEGRTWETNWIVTDTRVGTRASACPRATS
jgi:hypothetical protein